MASVSIPIDMLRLNINIGQIEIGKSKATKEPYKFAKPNIIIDLNGKMSPKIRIYLIHFHARICLFV